MRIVSLLVVLAAVATAPPLEAQQASEAPPEIAWGRVTKPPFLRMVLPHDLSIEMPGRNGEDWHASAGSGNLLLFAIERKKGEAALWIETVPLKLAISERIEDAFLLQAAAEDLKLREPAATQARHAVVERDGRRFLYSTYVRNGLSMTPERVLQYFFRTPTQSYRFVCASDAAVAGRYAAICGHMAWSFASTLPADGPAAAPAPH